MLGFFDLAGSDPCKHCGSTSGDCDWVRAGGRCDDACDQCHGANVGRCAYCDEVVPCGMAARRNPRPDALCAWDALARLHAASCLWTSSRGGSAAPLPAVVRRYRVG
jgi:hypothetical protein